MTPEAGGGFDFVYKRKKKKEIDYLLVVPPPPPDFWTFHHLWSIMLHIIRENVKT